MGLRVMQGESRRIQRLSVHLSVCLSIYHTSGILQYLVFVFVIGSFH